MITARTLRERMNRQPFKPFRICLSDGKSFDITNHDIAFIKSNTVEIGIELDAQGFAEHCAECAILHITRLEDIPTAQAQRFRKVVWIYGWSRHPIFSPGGSAASDVPASLGSGQSFA